MTSFVIRLAGFLCAVSLSSVALAQSDRPLRLVVPFGPGGGSDTIARIIQNRLAEGLKRTVIIENRPGAGGTLGASNVAKSPPDGNTLLLADAGVVTISPSLYGDKLPYAATDLVPVLNVAQFAHVLIAASSFPANNVAELVALDKAHPGKLSIASSGNGASPHLTAEMFKTATGLQLVHVPYKGSGPAIADTLGGQVDMMFTGYATVSSLIKSGKLKALAVTSPKRIAELPQVKTVAESGYPGFESWISQAVFAPKGTPPEMVKKFNLAIAAVLRLPDVREQLKQQGLEPFDNTPEEFAAWTRQQTTQWDRVIRSAGVKPD